MGFGDKLLAGIKNAAHSAGNIISTGFNKVVGAAQSAGTKIGNVISGIAQKGEAAVSTVYHDVVNLPNTIGDNVSKVIGAGGNALSSIGGSLMIPLTVVGGVAAFALLKK